MKRFIIFFKSKQKDNRGLSLIELILAIAILAIVITPIFNSFITSARVNLNARKTLAATDVAQDVLEGFADKGFSVIVSSIGRMGNPASLSGNFALSSVNNNYYNMAENFEALPTGPLQASGLISGSPSSPAIAINTINFNGAVYNNIDLISGNAVPIAGNTMNRADTVSINQVVAASALQSIAAAPETKGLLYWMDTDNSSTLAAALVYTDIEVEGFHFDAVVTFLPMAQTENAKYYPYCVTVSVYDADSKQDSDGDGATDRLVDDVLMNVMIGGMAK